MTREEKIEIIKGLTSGEIKPEDIRPKKLRLELGDQGIESCSIDGKLVTKDEFHAQWGKQFIQDDESTYPEIIINGVNMNDPEYLEKTIARMKAEGKLRIRQIGVNSFETY